MQISVFAVGRLKSGPERELITRYFDRFQTLAASNGIQFKKVVELADSRASNSATRKREEAETLRKHLRPDSILVLLDERGKTPGSNEFAKTIENWRDQGRKEVVLSIGGADGHSDELRAQADLVISFGRLTWPHQLARIMLAEQLYRAMTIITGHPYHRN